MVRRGVPTLISVAIQRHYQTAPPKRAAG